MVKKQTYYFYLLAKVKFYWTTLPHYISIESLLVFLTKLKLALSGIPSSWMGWDIAFTELDVLGDIVQYSTISPSVLPSSFHYIPLGHPLVEHICPESLVI